MRSSSDFPGRGIEGLHARVERMISEGRALKDPRHRCGDCMDLGLRYRLVAGGGKFSHIPVSQVARCHCKASLRWSELISTCEELDVEAVSHGKPPIKWYTRYEITEVRLRAVREAKATRPPEEGDLG